MAVRAPKPTSLVGSQDQAADHMDLTFPEERASPEGGEMTFKNGALKGKTFIDMTMNHPEQYCVSSRSKGPISKEMSGYVSWVNKHFHIDNVTKQVRHLPDKTHLGGMTEEAAEGVAFTHEAGFHGKGSSARYICKTCRA